MEGLQLRVCLLEKQLLDQNVEIKHMKLLIQQLFNVIGNDTSAVDAKGSNRTISSEIDSNAVLSDVGIADLSNTVPILAKIKNKRKKIVSATFQGNRKKFRAIHAVSTLFTKLKLFDCYILLIG